MTRSLVIFQICTKISKLFYGDQLDKFDHLFIYHIGSKSFFVSKDKQIFLGISIEDNKKEIFLFREFFKF